MRQVSTFDGRIFIRRVFRSECGRILQKHGYREQKMVILAFLQSGTVHTFARLKKRPRGFDMEYAVMGGAAVSLVRLGHMRTWTLLSMPKIPKSQQSRWPTNLSTPIRVFTLGLQKMAKPWLPTTFAGPMEVQTNLSR